MSRLRGGRGSLMNMGTKYHNDSILHFLRHQPVLGILGAFGAHSFEGATVDGMMAIYRIGTSIISIML
jgi:hypothetical protein